MVEQQFATFLVSQMRNKIGTIDGESNQAAVRDLSNFADQLEALFEVIFASKPKTRNRKKENTT